MDKSQNTSRRTKTARTAKAQRAAQAKRRQAAYRQDEVRRSAGTARRTARPAEERASGSRTRARETARRKQAARASSGSLFLRRLKRAFLIFIRAVAFLASGAASAAGSFFRRLKVFGNPVVLISAAAKWAAFALIAVLLYSRLHVTASSATGFDTMAKIAQEAADLTNTVQGDNQMVRRLYGLSPSDYDGVLLFCPRTNMGAEELFLVKLRDKSQEEGVMQAVEKRLETQLASFNGYGVDQTEMLEKSVSLYEGGYCLFYSGTDPAKVRSAVREAL